MRDARTIPMIPYGAFSRQVHERAARNRTIIKAQLELTYRCNLHCRHCYTDPYNSGEFLRRELSRTEIERLLDDLREIGVVWLNLTGGDIFMHPEFFAIYESAYRRGFLLQLYTNGTLFTRSIVERLERMPPFTIDISCHSVREERFDWFTQVPGSYRAFMRGIALLRGSTLAFSLKTKLMSWNQDELSALRAFTESLGRRFSYTTSLSPRLNGDCSALDYRIAPEDLVAIGRAELREDDGASCRNADRLARPDTDRLFRCGCGTDTIHINAWGELSTCTFQYESRVSLRQMSLREAVAKVFAEVHGMRYRDDAPCRSCRVHQLCDKQPTQARWEMGDPQAPIPYDCDVAVARAELTLQRAVVHPLRSIDKEITADHDGEEAVQHATTLPRRPGPGTGHLERL